MRSEADKNEAVQNLSAAVAAAIKSHAPVEPSDVISVAIGLLTYMASNMGAEPSTMMATILVTHGRGGDVARALDAVRLAGVATKIHEAQKGRLS